MTEKLMDYLLSSETYLYKQVQLTSAYESEIEARFKGQYEFVHELIKLIDSGEVVLQ